MTDDDICKRLGPISDAERAEIEAEVERMGHTPNHDELRQLLVRYFVGPITDDHVTRVMAAFDSHQTLDQQDSLLSRFESVIRDRGWAWKEEIPGDRRSMAPVDQMMLEAHVMWAVGFDFPNRELAFPQPKLHCPPSFVGSWEQLEPAHDRSSPLLWHFDADGSFRSNTPDIPGPVRYWCVFCDYYRSGRHSSTLDIRCDLDRSSWWNLANFETSGDELAGVYLGHAYKIPFRLRRHSP